MACGKKLSPPPWLPALKFQHLPDPWYFLSLSPAFFFFCKGTMYFTSFFFFKLWPYNVAFRILVPWSGIKPGPPAVEVHSLNHWTSKEVHTYYFIEWLFSPLECKLQGEEAGFLSNHWTSKEVHTYYFIEWLFSPLECKLQGEEAGFLSNLFIAGSPLPKPGSSMQHWQVTYWLKAELHILEKVFRSVLAAPLNKCWFNTQNVQFN